MLRKTKTGESIQIIDEGKKIWEVTKGYGADNFEDDSSCIGYRIDVYQESINQQISEYLVNFDYLDRIMEAYGFKIISREEAEGLGLPEGSGLFSELFINMLDEIKRNKYSARNYGDAPNMSKFERKISELNRYFVYKKIREVNTEKVEIELGEYEEFNIEKNSKETKEAVVIVKKEIKQLKPKIRKLNKKILLVAATEAIDEPLDADIVEKKIKEVKPKKTIKEKKPKKVIIIEED